jgi:hypothetical protein
MCLSVKEVWKMSIQSLLHFFTEIIQHFKPNPDATKQAVNKSLPFKKDRVLTS